MNNIKRYYNQNRKKLWSIIIIVAFLFALLQLANGIARNNNRKQIEQARITENNTSKSDKGAANTTTTKGTTTANENSHISIIEQFINYCNNKELDKAYEMITDECKEQMFNNIETFERIYYNSAFENKKKEFKIENWVNNTYMVTIKESALALGKKENEEQKVDYITVVEDEEENLKLNINNYIGYTKIEKSKEKEGIIIEAIGKHTYMNHEEFIIKVTNNSNEDTILDHLGSNRSLYIEDSNGVAYYSYNHELTQELLSVSRGHTKELNIKFYSSYVSTKRIKSLVFSNLQKGNINEEFRIEL